MADSREVMNIRQASQYLGVRSGHAYKYVGEQSIPAFKLGNRALQEIAVGPVDGRGSRADGIGSETEPKAAGKAAGRSKVAPASRRHC